MNFGSKGDLGELYYKKNIVKSQNIRKVKYQTGRSNYKLLIIEIVNDNRQM